MNKRNWSADDLAEYEALVGEALAESVVPRRIDIFLDGLDDALQGHRYWADDVLNDMRRNGSNTILKREQELRRPRVPVAHNNQVVGKMPREVGRKLRDDDGKTTHARGLFDFLTWTELRDKLDEYQRNRQALDVDILALRKLLTLQETVPDATTPAEACERLGITVEDFLGQAGAA